MRSENETYFSWNFVFLSLTVRNHLAKLLMLVVLGILSTWFSRPFPFSLRESSPRHSGGGWWGRVVGEGKEEELATTSLEVILNFTSNSPVVPHQLSCQISVNYHETETSANVNKHWKTGAKGNDVITDFISANLHFASTFNFRCRYSNSRDLISSTVSFCRPFARASRRACSEATSQWLQAPQ